MFSKADGRTRYLCRAVDQDENVLDILATDKRAAKAAKRFSASFSTASSTFRGTVTDRLRSCGAAHRQVMPSIEYRSSKYPNNQAENSYIPAREREQRMKGFRRVGTAQRYLASFSRISPHFRPRRHLMPPGHHTEKTNRFTIWHQITGTTLMATTV